MSRLAHLVGNLVQPTC